MYRDLRDFIDLVDGIGDLKRVSGADQDFEIGGITEVAAGAPECPALLFDEIPGQPAGNRIFSNATVNARRAALALGIDHELPPIEILKAWKRKRAEFKPIEPDLKTDGPFLENAMETGQVDVTRFPCPIWHRKDGGAYIGSGSLVITKDPDSGWVNAAIYRVQVHGPDTLTVQFDHTGRHGAMISRKYWNEGRPCPIAIVNGQDPALFMSGFEYLPEGQSEYAFAGGIKGMPVEVCPAPLTGLPVPTHSEIVLEGELLPFDQHSLPEGPFGEFTGYYAADKRPAPVMKVTGAYYRSNPILLGSPPMKPPRFHFGIPLRAAGIWSNLESCGVSDVVGAWQHVSQLMTVVALKQRYAGHSKRAALIAAANSYMGRVVVVVDEDVDPSNLADVMWAVTTRAEPSEDVDIIRRGWSSALDPRLSDADREVGLTGNSKLIIDACIPFERLGSYPPTSALTLAEAAEIKARWKHVLA